MSPRYLGDGAYVEPTDRPGYVAKVYTSNGIQETNVVWLEYEAAEQLAAWLTLRLKEYL